jgi:hypothetical protein
MKIEFIKMRYKYVLSVLAILFYSNFVNAQNTLDRIGLTSTNPASVAFSLRQLSNSYTGPLVRIKVATLFYDVYPDASTKFFTLNSKISASVSTYNATVSAASANELGTIITDGTTNATVAIWYDQSGNAVNVLNSGSTGPKIITLGSIQLMSGKPSIYFAGVSANTAPLISSKTVNYSAQQTATISAIVQNLGSTSNFSGIYSTGNNGGWGLNYDPNGSALGYWLDGSECNQAFSGAPSTAPKIITGFLDKSSSSSIIYENRHLLGTKTLNCDILNGTADNICIGIRASNGEARKFDGNISEVILFPSILTVLKQTSLEENQNLAYLSINATITSSPSGIVLKETNITFTANVYNFSSTLAYQWYKNSIAISEATSSTYSTTSLTSNDQVYVEVNNISSGSIPSSGLLSNLDAGNSTSYPGSGSTWNDISVNNYNTTLYNSPTYSSTNGGSLVFDGISQYGQTPNTITSFNQGTFIAWIKRNGSQGNTAIIKSSTGAYPVGLNIVNNYLTVSWGGISYWTDTDRIIIPDNTWCMVALKVYASKEVYVYLIGPTTNYQRNYKIPNPTVFYPTAVNFKIGVDDLTNLYFNGNIGQALIYNTLLTATEIESIYNYSATRFGYTQISRSKVSNTILIKLLTTPIITTNGDTCVNKTSLTTPADLTSYEWYKDNVAIPSATSNSYIPTASGAYQVKVTNGSVFSTSTATIIYMCGRTEDGKMSILETSTKLVGKDGAINNGYGVDDRGLLLAKP